jgi:hypothetical protein
VFCLLGLALMAIALVLPKLQINQKRKRYFTY